MGYLSSHGDQELAHKGVPVVLQASPSETDLRDHKGLLTGSEISELSIESSSRGFQELPHQFTQWHESLCHTYKACNNSTKRHAAGSPSAQQASDSLLLKCTYQGKFHIH